MWYGTDSELQRIFLVRYSAANVGALVRRRALLHGAMPRGRACIMCLTRRPVLGWPGLAGGNEVISRAFGPYVVLRPPYRDGRNPKHRRL